SSGRTGPRTVTILRPAAHERGLMPGTPAPLSLGTFPALSWGRGCPLSHKGTISAVPLLDARDRLLTGEYWRLLSGRKGESRMDCSNLQELFGKEYRISFDAAYTPTRKKPDPSYMVIGSGLLPNSPVCDFTARKRGSSAASRSKWPRVVRESPRRRRRLRDRSSQGAADSPKRRNTS